MSEKYASQKEQLGQPEIRMGYGSYFEPFALKGVIYDTEGGKNFPKIDIQLIGLEHHGIPNINFRIAAYPYNAVKANAVTPFDPELAATYPPVEDDFDVVKRVEALKKRKIKPGDKLGMKYQPLRLTVHTPTGINEDLLVAGEDEYRPFRDDVAEELQNLRVWASIKGYDFTAEPEDTYNNLLWFSRFFHPDFGDFDYDEDIRLKVAPQLDNRFAVMLPTHPVFLHQVKIMIGDVRYLNDAPPLPTEAHQISPQDSISSRTVPIMPAVVRSHGFGPLPYGRAGASPAWRRLHDPRNRRDLIMSILEKEKNKNKKDNE